MLRNVYNKPDSSQFPRGEEKTEVNITGRNNVFWVNACFILINTGEISSVL